MRLVNHEPILDSGTPAIDTLHSKSARPQHQGSPRAPLTGLEEEGLWVPCVKRMCRRECRLWLSTLLRTLVSQSIHDRPGVVERGVCCESIVVAEESVLAFAGRMIEREAATQRVAGTEVVKAEHSRGKMVV